MVISFSLSVIDQDTGVVFDPEGYIIKRETLLFVGGAKNLSCQHIYLY
jgi:hypothetical protein